ncbi:MAG: hypothetical protein P8K08_10215 [Fuerstiella sp.]|nr:hypothetical protein [Fuerstiella sp.]
MGNSNIFVFAGTLATPERLSVVLSPAPPLPACYESMSEPSPEELLSAEFDDLTSAGPTMQMSPQDLEMFQQWRDLGDCLRAIPIESSRRISVVVRKRIESPQSESSRREGAVSTESPRHIRRNVIAILTAAAAITIVTVPVSFLVRQTDSMSVPMMADAGGVLANVPAQVNRLLPANSREWEVVVVTVSEQKLAEVSSRLRQSIGENGLEIQALSEASSGDDQTMGVLMSSAETSWELLVALDTGFDDGVEGDIRTEWNPQQIGDFDRDELLARLTESMNTPTQSDVYFGEMFVVVPTNDTLVMAVTQLNADEHRADADNNAESTVVSANTLPAASRAGRTESLPVAAGSERVGGRPVLVLFQRRTASGDSQGNYRQRHGHSLVDHVSLPG